MASPNVYTHTGGGSGAELATRYPVLQSGKVWHVYSGTGADAASPRGLDRIRPLATIAQAHTNASAGDTIRLLEGHTETLTAAQTFNKAGIHVESEGVGSTRARFTCNGAIAMFDATADCVSFENIYFVASGTAPTARVRIAGVGGRIKDCYFECGTNDTAPALKFVTGAGRYRVEGCTFISTSTSISSQPAIGLEVANAMTDLYVGNCVFDGGSSGWSDFALKGTAAITRLYAIDISLLRDSDLYLATASIHRIHVKDRSGSARLEITA